MDLHDPADGSTNTEDQHPPPLREGETAPRGVSSLSSPAWALSPPTAPHDPLPWTLDLHSSLVYSPPQWHHMTRMIDLDHDVAGGGGNLLEYDGEHMMSALPAFQSSPQALSPMLVDVLWSFDDQQISSTEMDPGPAEANDHAAAARVPVQGTSSGVNPGSPRERVERTNHKWQFHLSFEESSDTSCLFKERLTQALRYYKESTTTDQHLLVQVWAPVKNGDRYVLVTSGQPFVLDHPSIGLLQFRAVSMMYMFSIDGDSSGELGLPGRVYLQKVPEWTPNVQYYSSTEYPLLNHAINYHVHGALALPVFDPSTQSCISVVELLWSSKKINYEKYIDNMCKALEAVNLKSTNTLLDHPRIQISDEGRQCVLVEILEVLTIICEEHKLPLAQTWIYGKCNHQICWDMNSCILTSDVAFHVTDPHMWGFRDACVEHHLQRGHGLPGKAFCSRTACFSKDVRSFCKLEYPLVHYARMFGLAASVAVCVQSSYTRYEDYIVEFFLPPNCRDDDDQKALLQSILTLVTQGFRSLRLVGDADLSIIYSQNLLHSDGNEKPKNTFPQCEGFHCSSPPNNTHDGLGVQRLNTRKKRLPVKQFSRDASTINNERGVDSDLIELSNRDVEVGRGDVPPKRRKLKSKAWLHFTKVEDSGFVKAKCNYCGKLYKADPKIDGTSRPLKHLRKVHPMELSANQEGTSIHEQGKVLSECREIVHDNVPNEVVVLDSQYSGDVVGMISRIEEQLLTKINSATEQEVLVQIDDVTLHKRVMESLANPKLEDGPQKYLQDDIIDAYIHILKDKNKDDIRAHGRVFIETTAVCQLLHKAACSIYPIRGREIKDLKKYGTEYLKHDMIFLPINQNCNHWYLVVINTKKQEIHVLDSLGKHLQEREELKYTLKQIEQCLELANSEVQCINWPDYKVVTWNVTQENRIPKQTDMSSCGLFMIKYMEYWTGEKLSKEFTQADIDLFRIKLACELMSTPLNKAGNKEITHEEVYLAT